MCRRGCRLGALGGGGGVTVTVTVTVRVPLVLGAESYILGMMSQNSLASAALGKCK